MKARRILEGMGIELPLGSGGIKLSCPRPGRAFGDYWDLLLPDDQPIGEFIVGTHDENGDVPVKVPWVEYSKIDPTYRGHGYGRMAMKALVKHYGVLRSSRQGLTSGEADKAWQAIGAKRLTKRDPIGLKMNRRHLDQSDYVLGRHQVSP